MSTVSNINELLMKMWNDYISMTPQAQKIVDLIESHETGNKVINDHIALRTFNHPKLTIDVISKPLLDGGYKEAGEYIFEEKKLKAKHFKHDNPGMPLIFISELLLEEFSGEFNAVVDKLVDQVTDITISDFSFLSNGRPWSLSSSDYNKLKEESDYGAWISAIGYRPNHFTVFINELNSWNEVSDLNTFLKDNGFKLNASGGEVKGSKEVFLEQSSTLADSIEVKFSDKNLIIPSCYYEFAKRYVLENGDLYQGFVAKSADKIFESTSGGQ